MAGAAIPLYLITGFLGSGKTTLLAHLIRQAGFRDTAVIVNEFGDVGLDHALVAQGDEANMVLLDSGCICCTLTSSLEETLEALYYRRERGEIPDFARVVVETTGLADPGPIATALAGGMFTARYVRLGAIITCVDAVAGAAQMTEFDEARQQVAIADRIVLTKTDIADTASAQLARASVAALNPAAGLIAVNYGAVDAAILFSAADATRMAPAVTHAHHLHQHGYASATTRIAMSVSWPRYAAFVAKVQSELPTSLLRAKGILRFDDGQLRTIQAVRLLFSPPALIDWPIDDHLIGQVVLIAKGVTSASLQSYLQQLQEPEK